LKKSKKAIYLIRGEKVMLDRDLAKLYGVPTGALNQAVRRNRERFPQDFMFQLTSTEVAKLNLSQIVIGLEKHRDPRLRPYAFTEQGVAMLPGYAKNRSKCGRTSKNRQQIAKKANRNTLPSTASSRRVLRVQRLQLAIKIKLRNNSRSICDRVLPVNAVASLWPLNKRPRHASFS
jgi:hypothetical protein